MSRDIFFIFLLLFVCVLTVECKTCQSMDIRNSPTELRRLRNCTEIVGHLKILLMDKVQSESEFDDYVFPELTRITGYLFFYNVKKLTSVSRLFPNLMVIRGYELFTDYSLVLYSLPDLKEIGTSRLLYIARGFVKVDKCPLLCNANTIDWKGIGTKLDYRIPYGSHNVSSCEACPRECDGYCWNPSTCQEFRDIKCHPECLGCKEPDSPTHCFVCKNYDDHGTCVSKCPTDQKNVYKHGNSYKCVTEDECVSLKLLRTKWWIFNDECMNECPTDYEKVRDDHDNVTCSFCGNNCTKWCEVSEPIENLDQLQRLKGCTNINGSLMVRLAGVDISTQNQLVEDFDEYLGSVKYIRDTLVIAWTQTIKSLSFLRNLRLVKGENLGKDEFAIFFFENQNLQKLWDFEDKNFTIQVERGGIAFHYNPQLCESEIMKLVNMTNPSNSSIHYNGDRSVCNFVDFAIDVTVNITNATLTWETPPLAGNDNYIGFTVYYIEHSDGNITEYSETCDVKGWKSQFVRKNSTILLNLLPFTRYAYYIKIYRRLMEGGRSGYKYFKTLTDDPDMPAYFSVSSPDHQSIRLKWEPPIVTNGQLMYYKYDIDEEPDMEIQMERDYCRYPRTVEGDKSEEDLSEEPEIDPQTNTTSLTEKGCACENNYIIDEPDERSILLMDRYLPLCDIQSQTKFGFDRCQHLLYKPIEEIRKSKSLFEVDKRTSTVKKSRPPPFNNRIAANFTEYTIKNLKHFTLYIIYFSACNDAHKCSPVLQRFARTRKRENADDIEMVETKVENSDVLITWSEPKKPNSVIVSYNIEFKRADVEYSKSTMECLARNHLFQGTYYRLSNLLPGQYSVHIQAVSLAGHGRYSPQALFEIEAPSKHLSWILPVLLVMLSLVALALWCYIRYKKKHKLDNIHLIATINPDYDGAVYIADEWEIDRTDIELQKDLGHGTFGTVYSGLIKSRNLACAIKTVNETISLHDRMEFLNEASVMKSFNNSHHVVKLLGVVSKGQPPLVIMELMERGDLKKFLRRTRDSSQNVTANEIYRMSVEIADGMAYLSAKKYVHRDLAARNCMVATDRTVKIGDFGMARDIYETDYYRKETKGLLPVRWMAPESLADGVFTSDSDVWSYGIVLWEIATLAEQPYQGLSNEQVLQFVVSKGRLDRPSECPDLLYEIMDACWSWRPNDRPTFMDIVEKLEDHVGEDFKLVSFIHSREGLEHRMNHGRERAYNPPALGMGAQEHDLYGGRYHVSEEEVNLYLGDSSRPRYLPTSLSQRLSRFSPSDSY